MTKAIYAGSFDPITNGHLWLIKKATSIFDEVIVAIGNNPYKKCFFPLELRFEMLKDVLGDDPQINIKTFSQEFLVNFAKQVGAKFIVRGIRNAQDFDFEKTIKQINSDLNPEIETVYLIPPRNYAEISSSLIKGFMNSNGWENVVKQYVPLNTFNHIISFHK